MLRHCFAVLAVVTSALVQTACASSSPPPAVAPSDVPETKMQPLLDINDPAREPDVVFWPTPPSVVQKMIEVADIKSTDVVYDLGSGDGRIVIAAAKARGAHGVGYEFDAKLVEQSKQTAKEQGVDQLVTFERKDMFTVDLTPATVVMLYILPGMMQRLIPQLKKLKPGTRIVSHNYPMPGVDPDQTFNADEPGVAHIVMLWTTPLHASPKAAGP